MGNLLVYCVVVVVYDCAAQTSVIVTCVDEQTLCDVQTSDKP